MVFIVYEMFFFLDVDVVVFSNCDLVCFFVYDGIESWMFLVVYVQGYMFNVLVIFKDVWDFWEVCEYSYK